MKDKTTVLLCDDHTLFREGIKAILRDEPSIEIVDEADNGRDAVTKAERLRPDVVLMDIAMPDLGGFEATSRILRSNPKSKVLILTMYEEEEVITRCLRAGAAGYVLKDAPRSDLIHAIDVVKRGGQYLSSRALKKVVTQHVKIPRQVKSGKSVQSAATDYERLSDREREVLKLLADGLYFVGLDVIGERLTEVNVTSPTGIQELGRFTGARPSERVIEWVEGRAKTAL